MTGRFARRDALTTTARVGRTAVPAALVVALTAGCTPPSLADLPLPGGGPSGPAYHVTVEFGDVLDLVPQSSVKVNDVTVGSVEKIWLSGWTARVRLKVDRNVRLPDNATAAVRQTSLLGEKFVALDAPTGEKAVGSLSEGDVIPLSRTRRSAEIEEVLGALGLLLNGGGLAQLKTINEELGKALEGRESNARSALRQLDTFVGGLDAQKADIVRAIEALDRLNTRLAAQRTTIGGAVDALGPGLTVLAEQRAQLTTALTALGDLGKVGTRVINQTRDDTLASLRALQPILSELVAAGDNLPKSLDFMLSYPFPPNAGQDIVGDAMNLHITLDMNAANILSNLLIASSPQAATPPTAAVVPRKPTLPAVPPVLGNVLPPICIPTGAVLPGLDKLPAGCALPPECKSLPPGSAIPPGAYLPPEGVIAPGTVLPPGTRLTPGTILTPACILPVIPGAPALPVAPGSATGEIIGQIGGLTDVLKGGLHP